MIFLRAAGVVLALLVVGYLLCPLPSGSDVDPNKLLDTVFQKLSNPNYQAVQSVTCEFYGETLKRTFQTPLSKPDAASFDLNLVKANYCPIVEGSDVVAGRQAWALRLKPLLGRRSYPWKQLWVDKETGVILASRGWSSHGTMKSSMDTLSIRYTGPASFSAHPSADASLRPLSTFQSHKMMLPRFVPRGFKMFGVALDTHSRRAQIVYSDGLYALSVFETANDASTPQVSDGIVYDWGQGQLLSTHKGSVHIVVIGDLPTNELRKISASIR